MTSTALRAAESSGFDKQNVCDASFVHSDDLRTAFALAMSQMYKNEVPLYGDLMRIVHGINETTYQKSASEHCQAASSDSLDRLTLERHGAIRLGQPTELRTARRIFALLGMHPVGYYDLSVAGLPMHATCFRPIDQSSLQRNPFRVFTTLLRPKLLRSERARDVALRLLSKRQIFSTELMRMLNVAEHQDGRLYPQQAETFIREALGTFSWAPLAASTHAEYQVLKQEHPILADIACFKTAHINHLTPRTLDISATQDAMSRGGMGVKDRIEGPPFRICPILLRQTSFLALEESIQFQDGGVEESGLVSGSHRARFGEIEERGAAVTPAGRKLYDELLVEAMEAARGLAAEDADAAFGKAFDRYPDTWAELRKRSLIYCQYRCTGKTPMRNIDVTGNRAGDSLAIEPLIEDGTLEVVPITYEDFLPFSAAGIFQSNLDGRSDAAIITPCTDIESMEMALECSIIDPDALYGTAQSSSLVSSLSELLSIALQKD